MDQVNLPLSSLPESSQSNGLQNLGNNVIDSLQDLQREGKGLVSEIGKNPVADGPARNGELSSESLVRSLEHTTKMGVHLHENLTKFQVLSTSLTSFGNNLNSFLKGQ